MFRFLLQLGVWISCGVLFTLTPVQAQSTASELVFTEAYIWRYNETAAPNTSSKEVWVYYAPEMKYWLFTADAFGETSNYIEWVLAQPDGRYVIARKNANQAMIYAHVTAVYKPMPFEGKPIPATHQLKATIPPFSTQAIKAYVLHFEKTNDQSEVYLVDYPIDLSPIYAFNALNCEAKLPFSFPFGIGNQHLLLFESYRGAVNSYEVEFVEVTQTEYWIALPKL